MSLKAEKQKEKGKGKGNWDHGRQPRIHPYPPPPTKNRAVRCPHCDQVLVILIEDLPGGYRLEAARQYIGGVSAPTFHRLVKRGLIRPNRAIRHLIFPRAELERFLNDNLSENGGQP